MTAERQRRAKDRAELESLEQLLHVPVRIRAILTCPDCGLEVAVAASMFARRTKDSDGTTSIALRTKAPKVAHSCDQLTLDAAATGDLSR